MLLYKAIFSELQKKKKKLSVKTSHYQVHMFWPFPSIPVSTMPTGLENFSTSSYVVRLVLYLLTCMPLPNSHLHYINFFLQLISPHSHNDLCNNEIH